MPGHGAVHGVRKSQTGLGNWTTTTKCSLGVCLHALSTAGYFGILQKVSVKVLLLLPAHVCFDTEAFAGSWLSAFIEDPVRAIKTISRHSYLENISLFSRSYQIFFRLSRPFISKLNINPWQTLLIAVFFLY